MLFCQQFHSLHDSFAKFLFKSNYTFSDKRMDWGTVTIPLVLTIWDSQ